ncbi:MAG: molybdopterin-dependent oxidoreductase [Actinomycetales bacterium]
MSSDPEDATADRRRFGRLAGLASGLVTVGVADLVAAFVHPQATPVLAVGSAFIDLTPTWLKDAAVRAFGTNDKGVLILGILAVVALLAALAGAIAVRRLAAGLAVVGWLAVIAAAAALTRSGATYLDVVPIAVGALAGGWALSRLVRRASASAPAPTREDGAAAVRAPFVEGATSWRPPQSADPTRRTVLLAGAGIAGLAATGLARVLADHRGAAAARTSERITLPAPSSTATPLPRNDLIDVPGITPWRTPTQDFYRIDTALLLPDIAASQWQLRLHGMVDREVTLDFASLAQRELIERWVTLTCVSNPVGGDLAGNALWLGARLRDLLLEAGVSPDADMVLATSKDGFTTSTPLDVLLEPDRDALLAIGMNGSPLPQVHGFPVRRVVPGLYGYVSACKWVVDLKVTRFDREQAYWTERGWSPRGPIKTASRIDVPREGATVKPGNVAVGGVAWAQHRGISAVQVRVDGGAWHEAKLGATASKDAWRQWEWTWAAITGDHTLEVRAIDGTGAAQTAVVQDVLPDGATGYHSVDVRVG